LEYADLKLKIADVHAEREEDKMAMAMKDYRTAWLIYQTASLDEPGVFKIGGYIEIQ
jgi:hypothetical protein